MNLRQLEFFKTLAEKEHMTQAALELNTTQPNLSHSMNELEKELGTKLFKKTGRNIRLTKYGNFFYGYVSASLDELKRGERALKELISPEKGQIDFGFIYTLGPFLAPLLMKEFLALEENHALKFQLSQGNSTEMIQTLLTEKSDIVLCSKIIDNEKIHYEKVAEQEIVLIVPLNHPLAVKDEICLSETKDYPYIYFNKNSGLRPFIDDMLQQADISPTIILEVEEDHSMAGFVGFEFGIAIMPRIAALDFYPVKVLKIKEVPKQRFIYLATLKNHTLSPAAVKFKTFILDYGKTNFLSIDRLI